MDKTNRWLKWLSLATGLAALVWFLARVIPKPSRASYPCQRAAAPLAGGFLVWLAGLFGARWLHHKAKGLALAGLAAIVFALWLPLGVPGDIAAQEAYTPSDPPNRPIGVGQGIHPGRVVWVRQPDAARWDGKSGQWWDDANTDPGLVKEMMSAALRNLAGRKTDKEAWDALFRHFNQSRQLGKSGYRAGEKIAIKINSNQDRGVEWRSGQGMPSPQVVYTVVEQLIKVVGVAGKDITVYDASRYVGDPIYNRIRANPEPNFQAVQFVVRPELARNGRLEATPDKANPIHFAAPGVPVAYLPQCVTGAKYLVNLAILRPHTLAGVTLCAKNHFGSTYFPNNGGWTPQPLHSTGSRDNPMGSYNCLVDLIGHQHVAGKTLLYLLDGLYATEHQGGSVMRFASFGDAWTASLFASQDPVAIDSVGLDFLRNEPRATRVRGNPDNYMHEAALAGKPPSGTVYDPEQDGRRLASLGVHEHWNNAAEKKYSRNLGKSEGIELVAVAKQ